MKNVLMYYYNLNPKNIHLINKMYKFNINNDYYTLIEITEDINKIDEIYYLSNFLRKNGMYTHEIVLNLQNSIITFINNNNYILLKTYGKMDKIVDLNDIIMFSNNNFDNSEYLKKNNWYQMWINKIDYFKYQLMELKEKYPLIKESFNYFSGLTENAIQLLVNMNINKKMCICHNRIRKNYTLFDLYNPFNFIIDSNMRDISEYFKELFIYEDPYLLIEQFIKNSNLSEDELKNFFIRMMYPSFYFDLCEEIIKNNVSEDRLNNIINKVTDYEILLKKTYILIKNICHLPEIEWLN